ncbi:MFS transporter [Pseudonocardia sp. RS11V-5]|uniref:MFS transporter n=1 Tax=Pseudonocardia terrae TaxID=2905831 RepID=UPI001E618450|nr:MFS transporter [Pseudonocardia terrae]MCE3551102.1 MFS transporter [Pseudonocardia terrae]
MTGRPGGADGAERAEWRDGWPVVLAAALAYGGGPVLLLTTASVFVRPTAEATGWSTSQVLISPLLTTLFAALSPVAGRLADRFGARRVVAPGLVLYAAVLVVFAVTPVNLAAYYGMAVLMGVFGAVGYLVPINRAVATWFDKGAGKAFGLVGAGGAAAPLLGVPLVAVVVYTFGWKAGYLLLAGFVLVVALPAVLIGLRSRPVAADVVASPGAGARGGTGVRAVLCSYRFWIFALSSLLAYGTTQGFLANMQPIMLDGGFDVALATTATTLITVGVIVGRLGTGALLDAVLRYPVAIGTFTLSALGAVGLANAALLPAVVVIVAAMLVAVSQGAEGDIIAYFMLRDHGRAHFGTLFAAVYVVNAIGGFGGPYLFSLLRDASGSYVSAVSLGAVLFAVAAGLMGLYWATATRRRTATPAVVG